MAKSPIGLFHSVRRFTSDHYLPVTFLIFLTVAITASLLIYDMRGERAQGETREAVDFIILLVGLLLLLTWPRWLLSKLNATVRSAVQALGDSDDISDTDFKKRIGSVFGNELVSNIFTYETYCKNEYVLDMQKHHLAWLMLAVAGAITIVAAFLVIFSGDDGGLKWIEAIGVTLPALVTGVLLKIWLETRENLKKTRERTDTIYRQRLRLLLLVADHVEVSKAGWDDSISLNRKLLDYINLAEDVPESQGVGG